MKPILKQLYEGELFPAEQIYPRTEEYKALWRKHYSHYDSFLAKLDALEPDLSKDFIQIMDDQLEAVPLECSEMFTEGFRLGARLMMELYEKDR